jgi:hypothetical protein
MYALFKRERLMICVNFCGYCIRALMIFGMNVRENFSSKRMLSVALLAPLFIFMDVTIRAKFCYPNLMFPNSLNFKEVSTTSASCLYT